MTKAIIYNKIKILLLYHMAHVLGINLDEINQGEVLKRIANFLRGNSQHYIVTPNPEIILAAHKDEEFFHIINQADLSLADGFGLKIAGWLNGHNIPRITGADITVELLKMASQNKIKIMVLNWEKGLSLAADITSALKKKFPKLLFSVLDISRDKLLTPEIIIKINNFQPVILFATLGFPYQEKLIYHNLNKLPSARVALGIGGAFDFITEKIKRAPKIFRALGLEWFWRLLNIFNYPNSRRRLKRIYQATFVFLEKIIKARFINIWFYRPNVACWLYKKESDKIKVLIVERTDKTNHWQLPQGGTDGESIEMAGRRELNEEIGTDKFITRASKKNIYRYKFAARDKDNKDYKQYKYEYKGQSQGLFIAEFTGIDSDIKLNFWDHQGWKWVEIDELLTSVHPVRRLSCEKFLKIFQSLNIN